MSDNTKIPWCNATINPLQDICKGRSGRGYHCTKVGAGCTNCYAEAINKRFGNGLPFDSHETEFEIVNSELEKLSKWKKHRRIFVQSMGDIFHAYVKNHQILTLIDSLMSFQHTYIILTKRPYRIITRYFENSSVLKVIKDNKNIWVGVSVSTQAEADALIPALLEIPAAVRFVSIEPMIEPICLSKPYGQGIGDLIIDNLNWVIVGCESGPKRRLFEYNWARDIRNQCVHAGVPFFFKQAPDKLSYKIIEMPELDGRIWNQFPGE